MFHVCPNCGYEEIPVATCTPEVYQVATKKWNVAFWTNESEHRWVEGFDSQEAAETFAATVKVAAQE